MFARTLLVGLLLAALPGCGTLYLAQAARGQLQVMRERKPIDSIIADDRTPQTLRARLAEVRAARDFASQELSLPDNSSYRTYADVGRPFVVWNVVAAPEFSVEPLKWCFPIVGCVAYRGYFSERSARAFAKKLHDRGFDVTVGGVPAYSTLGRTADPVLNTMLRYGDTDLAAIMFHELAHQVVYVAGDSVFNESFATVVEQVGLERWLRSRGHVAELASHMHRKQQQQEYVDLFKQYRDQLAVVYASGLPRGIMRTRKAEILGNLAREMQRLQVRQKTGSGYASWLAEGLNNAQLASVATYYDCVPAFERMLDEADGNLPAFFSAVRRAAGRPRAERQLLCAGPPRH
jgi:predicted aminopeptidase